ncbi:MAG: hypothetical protein GEU74_08900 [Nitriliruptorales bacterium]|nr:hypothetical protein [Nitriliruptorales bacterium]
MGAPVVPAVDVYGVLLFGIVVMVALVPPLALFVQWRYRQAVRRSMLRAATTAGPAPGQATTQPPPRAVLTEPPQLRWEVLDGDAAEPDRPEDAFVAAMQARTVLLHVVAALSYGVVASAVFHAAARLGLSPVRFATLGLLFAWPLVPTLSHVLGGRGRGALLLTGYLVLLIVPGALGGAGTGGMMLLAAITIGPPAVLLLALTHHRLRAVGPFLAPCGLVVGVGFAVAPWLGLPLVNVTPSLTGIATILALGFLAAAAALGFVGVRWIAGRYERRQSSDRSLLTGQWWLFATMWLALAGFVPADARYTPAPLLALAAHQVVIGIGSRTLLRPATHPGNLRLLFLRTFGSRRRSERLLRDVTRPWAYLGTVQMIAGPDLATASLQPHEFLDFVRGRLARRFVRGPQDLAERLAAREERPDRDGRYRVEEYFCHDDTWRMTVQHLAAESSAVLMDLRGFTAANRGVAYELGVLVDLYPLEQVVLAVDTSTDGAAVRGSVERVWRAMDPASPNRTRSETTVRVLRLDGPSAAATPLMGALTAAASRAPDPAPQRMLPAPSAPLVSPPPALET